MNFKTIEWKKDKLLLIDQRRLPTEEVFVTCTDYQQTAEAIRNMTVRGAPAIGVTAAFGVVLGSQGTATQDYHEFCQWIDKVCQILFETRPTAVNLGWALEQMKKVCQTSEGQTVSEIKVRLEEAAIKIFNEDVATNRRIGEHGAILIDNGMTLLTHCNAGALATAGHGTALGVMYTAHEKGKHFRVFTPETRPWLQGARLSAWELSKNGIEVTLITDNMIASFMKKGEIDLVIVGADRIAANGDVANKIGTYGSAVLAKEHNIPFYVAAPFSTIDLNTPNGESIVIEERSPDEVTSFHKQVIAPKNIKVRNPAFDVTPADLISGIITEKGILRKPFARSLQKYRAL